MKSKVKTFVVTVVILISSILLWQGSGALISFIKFSDIRSLLSELFLAVLGVIILYCFGLRNVMKPSFKGIKEGISAGAVVIVLSSFLLFMGFMEVPSHELIPMPAIILFVIQMILVGIAEEFLFRGFVLNRMYEVFGKDTYKGAILSIVTSAVLFGIPHLLNAFAPQISLTSALIQMVCVIPLGVIFGAVYHRSKGNIWVCVMIHALLDLGSFISSGMLWGVSEVESIGSYNGTKVVGILIYASVAIWVARKKKIVA